MHFFQYCGANAQNKRNLSAPVKSISLCCVSSPLISDQHATGHAIVACSYITRSVARFARPLLACACISFVYTAWKVIAGPTL